MISAGLLTIDFGALRTLRLVYRHGSFSKAAADMGIKQSTVSYTIDRLRDALGDPLFIRQGNGITATERCVKAVEAAEHILSEVERLAIHADFDPATASETVTVSCNYYARMTFLGDVVRHVRSVAPGLKLRFVPGFVVGPMLLSGDVEIAITPIPSTTNGIYGQVIATDPVVCLLDKANPLAQGPISLGAYCAATHVYVDFGPAMKTVMERDLASKGLEIEKALAIPDPASLPNLILGTDLVATIPSRFARLFDDQLAVVPAPTTWQTKIHMYWPARLQRSPLNTWMRELIKNAAAEMEPPNHP